MRRYTTLWNVCAQKSQWSRAEWSELPCKTRPSKTVAQICSLNDVSTTLFTDEKICTVTTLEHAQNNWLHAHLSDVVAKPLRTDVRLLMASVGESQVVDITPVWYLSITESRLARSKLIKSQRDTVTTVPARHTPDSLSSEFFIFQQDGAQVQGAWGNQFSHIFAKCWTILQILSKQYQQ